MVDITVTSDGPMSSVFVFTPHTDAARVWIGENIPDDATRWAGGFVAEQRFALDIAQGMVDGGLTVK